ncbi:N-acetyl-1-D-myo-inositol-2-amino-2-deoxy-alpha-D-glucopyranoside deacetylase [Mycolicibacterium komossense]|uniref:1D-myo-inositol 2-acetamido-2-deoxy-alpha-D-glucopyranoside deacetylase n=1 Tax=Mycolicibacterium komossense TaxID=1779 RepID=A0ABT3CKE6_9MYCO|nr:N-acetyl-1-D-myo-inositol-2-amino-2-deoxy-alpha-D-glucopyranoside deacetylase [Mycolicibacterium komossense]MCV7229916.1 N-acetyl-1-D-myo-inositol-2-amino-2-deoxy-alpha-D-glucopyranoside deacetylase [Mycolicibacterium komossense]
MRSDDSPRLLFVHAHPDDETLNNGATIAHYAALGAAVHVVTCTLGEEGEVIGERWAQLAVDHADQLGGYRIGELTAALHLLGIGDPIFLGGAGHWRDSGMAGTEPRSGARRFADSDDREAIGALVDVIRELRPHVVVTYDPHGGYGHPDHIRAHQITTAAVAAAEGDDYPGAPWAVSKFYWTVMSHSAFEAAAHDLDDGDLQPGWELPTEAGERGWADEQITAVVDATDTLSAKVAALRAHATQVTVGPSGRACALSNNLALPIHGREHYVLVRGTAGACDERGWETDLLAGL